MRSRQRGLVILHRAIFGKNRIQNITTNTSFVTVKHGGSGWLMIWECFVVTVHGKLHHATSKWLKKKIMTVLEWLSQSPDVNPS